MNRSGESISERLQKLSLEKNINKTEIDAHYYRKRMSCNNLGYPKT